MTYASSGRLMSGPRPKPGKFMGHNTMAVRRHQRQQLAFVRLERGIPNHWAVTPSGNADQDYLTGFQHGCDALVFAETREDSTDLLICIFRAIIKTGRRGPLEIGFFDAVSVSAVLHQNSIRTGRIEKARPGVLKSD